MPQGFTKVRSCILRFENSKDGGSLRVCVSQLCVTITNSKAWIGVGYPLMDAIKPLASPITCARMVKTDRRSKGDIRCGIRSRREPVIDSTTAAVCS